MKYQPRLSGEQAEVIGRCSDCGHEEYECSSGGGIFCAACTGYNGQLIEGRAVRYDGTSMQPFRPLRQAHSRAFAAEVLNA